MTPPLHSFANIHAHGITGPDTITSVEPHQGIDGDYGAAWYSVGIHPWSTAQQVDDGTIAALDSLAADPRVVAIGETGLDKKRGGSPECQERIFLHHAALAEKLHKPLIIHCVGRYGRIMELRRQLAPSQLWVIHGFSGKEELARQLVAAGFGISLGRRSQASLKDILPPERVFFETD
ncbi:MAG: TatD family hydrolase [Muribaculaceae bacterium]|nr:TatD family hydrolase [Muribaculaceae bacterium]